MPPLSICLSYLLYLIKYKQRIVSQSIQYMSPVTLVSIKEKLNYLIFKNIHGPLWHAAAPQVPASLLTLKRYSDLVIQINQVVCN